MSRIAVAEARVAGASVGITPGSTPAIVLPTVVRDQVANTDVGQHVLEPEGGNLLLLLGAPRSGTTWIGKLFDSHPGVLYRHEPNAVLPNGALDTFHCAAEFESHRARAEAYLIQSARTRSMKSSGSLPHFAKQYRTQFGNLLHGTLVYGARAMKMTLQNPVWSRPIEIPDLIAPGKQPRLLVIKSVSWRGSAGIFARAMPQSRIVFIIRHPCGQVNSMLRGIREGRFENSPPFDNAWATPEGRRAGLSESSFESLNVVEQCAWNWAVLNQKTANDLAGLPRVRTVRYKDVCMRPNQVIHELFEFAGLDWNSRTEAFVVRCTTSPKTGRYYSVWRNSQTTAEKWRRELSLDEQKRILAIARQFPVGRTFEA